MNALMEHKAGPDRVRQVGGDGARRRAAMQPRRSGVDIRRSRRLGVDRSDVWRRPVGAPVPVSRNAVTFSTAPHTRVRSSTRSSGLGVVLGVAVLLALVIFIAVQVRSIGAAAVPSSVGTVEVATGDTLSGIASESAPGSPVGQVVDRIIELNELGGAGVHVGQSLLVPLAHTE